MGTGAALSVGDLFDVERQLLADRAADLDDVEERDRRVAARVAAGIAAGDELGLLRGWIDELRATGEAPKHGPRIDLWHRRGVQVAAAAGLVVGAGMGGALLQYDGSTPVNVFHYMAVAVGLQLLLLAALAAAWWRVPRRPGPGPVHSAIAAAVGLVARVADPPALRSAARELRALHRAFDQVERWLLVRASQVFGVAFNLALVATTCALVATTDIAFGWGTTLRWDAAAVHGAAEVVATPWTRLWPTAVPDRALVERTRYVRLEGAYRRADGDARAVDPLAVGGWWPFLVASVLTYGLFPRLVVWALAGLRVRRLLATAPLGSGDVQDLLARLAAPRIRSSGEPVAGAGAAAAGGGAPGDAAPEALPSSGPCTVILWGEVPIDPVDLGARVSSRLRWDVETVHRAGLESLDEDARALSAADANAPVLVVAGTFESPTGEVLDFLSALADRGAPVVVGLVAAGAVATPGSTGATPRSPNPASTAPALLDVWKRRVDRRIRVVSLLP